MRAPDHGAGNLVEVELHGFGVGVRHGEGRSSSACRTDGSEQIGALVALIGWLARSRPRLRPLSHDAVLLTDARLVLEPDLDRLALWQMRHVRVQLRCAV